MSILSPCWLFSVALPPALLLLVFVCWFPSSVIAGMACPECVWACVLFDHGKLLLERALSFHEAKASSDGGKKNLFCF